jgi:uncharacterized tellurite resistance protein B-like protein
MNPTDRTLSFQLGLLHLAHLLVNADGRVNEQEEQILKSIQEEENMAGALLHHFRQTIEAKTEQEVYRTGIAQLESCGEDEKLAAFVHLYRLARADDRLDMKEVRFLLYAVRHTQLSFEDVMLSARLADSGRPALGVQRRVA